MGDQRIDPGHNRIRKKLRIIGPILLGVGVLLTGIAFGSFALSFIFDISPFGLFLAFIGMPLTFAGAVCCMYGYMGKLARYTAQETAPVGKDTFNYLADGTQEGVRAVAGAIGQGLREGMSQNGGESKLRCSQCGSGQDSDAKFCDDCGAAINKERICPKCDNRNDGDARFCDNCGQELS
ncbi:MAG: zinc ribbon domain-containing protein [Planctomycetota bacterium]|jgi:hypothetical protein